MTQSNRTDYSKFPGFSQVYLEDSYVLGIEEAANRLVFQMEIVLREDHPFYSPPKPDEQYCYRKGKIVFNDVRSAAWSTRVCIPYKDASGKIDYGNIDHFYHDDGKYVLDGDWGSVAVRGAPPVLELALGCLSDARDDGTPAS